MNIEPESPLQGENTQAKVVLWIHEVDNATPSAASLALILPGASGLGRPISFGYESLARSLWQTGLNVAFCRTSGQDSIGGRLSLSQWLDETVEVVCGWLENHPGAYWVAFGSSAGGAIAANAAELVAGCRGVAVYETPIRWTQEMQQDVLENSTKHGVSLATDFFQTIVHMESANPNCRVVIFQGSTCSTTFSPDELRRIGKERPSWEIDQVKGAPHSIFRSEQPNEPLATLVSRIKNFFTECCKVGIEI